MWAVAVGVDTLRLITAIEAAAGFGLMTAAITYVLSIFPPTAQLSNAARKVQTQADDPALPVPLLLPGERPVGHIIRGTAMACLQARWGISTDAAHTPVCRGANCSFVFSTPSTNTPSAS
ncbi:MULTISPECIES: hypothetical protein [Micromonospora]|uniref:hypothetical protein n=1 Tax=Micromonospora TaxID=1873 RepID=UPI000206B795|nr:MULTISPECIES: hypothetical protein [Micromonospora]AEB44226.1 hypothetical protein VAB18032_15570 [Micromonospora maris AB-18-032]RUL89909.1 hypothetical protein EG812_28455 [Verrucosispora sp. FIM060022]